MQSRGTAKVAAFFGPIMVVWFAAIAVRGAVAHRPELVGAARRSIRITASNFLLHHGLIGFYTLGAVFLVVTGAEALYADLGHFGRGPIRVAWLVRGFAGAGCSIISGRARWCWPIRRRSRIRSSCFIRNGRLLPMVLLATVATVIASQAVITGAYSLTRQAIQLGLLPRLEIRHTSESLFGQIYMPRVNTLLLVGVLLLVGAVPLVERAGVRLRHRRDRHHGGHRHDGHRRDLARVALAADRRAGADACRSCSSI